METLNCSSLATLGASFGNNIMPGGKGNEKGFWEDNDIVALNNQLLEESNMTWHSITP